MLLEQMLRGRCGCLSHPSRTSEKTAAGHTQSLSIQKRHTRPPLRTHTRHRPKEACQPERKAQSPAPHAARHTDSPRSLRLFSWHCPLSSAFASATAPASPMPFAVASIPHIRKNSSTTHAVAQHPKAPHTPSTPHAHTPPTERRRAQHRMRQDTQTHW